MANRWESRNESKPGQGTLYWHILFRDQPRAQALASAAQERLTQFSGLHFPPQQWLHMTMLVVGLSEDFTAAETGQMVTCARESLAELSPITITLGKVFYHPEAIALGMRPQGALDPVLNAVWQATCEAVGKARVMADQPWNPHVTVAYSTAVQPAGPIIAALGRELPSCETTISGVNLVVQEGAERLWDWRLIADIPFVHRPD
jgi:2'-5' RNA ligase